MNSPLKRPNISDFENLPEYIRSMVHWRRFSEKGFSIAKAAREVGGFSPNLIYRVLRGDRGLTSDHAEVFCKLLALNSKEEDNFKKWLKLPMSRPVGSRRSTRVTKPPIERKRSNDLRSNWLHAYVLESVNHKGFKEDPEVIAKILGGLASPERIKKSLNFLIKNGFLKRNDKGKLIPDEEVYTSTRHVPNKNIRRGHRKAFDLAKAALEEQPIDVRNTSRFLFVATKERAKKYYALVDEFMDQVQELYQEEPDGNEEIYHMIIHFSPVVGKKNL